MNDISDGSLMQLAAQVGAALSERRLRLVTAESCTGGWIAKVATDLVGSSAWFDSGFVTYSNTAKEQALGVPAACLAEHGAVSEATVRAMAEGALRRSSADLSVAVSGIAGPGGGTAEKPVGTVCLAWSRRNAPTRVRTVYLEGERETVRRLTILNALEGLLDYVTGE